MEEICELEHKENNYAWCFYGLPEENAIREVIDGITIEVPTMIKKQPSSLLGEKVQASMG